MKNQARLAALLVLLILQSCVVIENQYTAVAPGLWRGQLILDQSIPAATYDEDAVIQDFEEVILPVIFEVKYLEDGGLIVEWINGIERIVADSVTWGRDKETGKDTIRIEFPVYDTHISALYEERVMEGHWEVHYKDNYRIPFVAFFGQQERFKRTGKAPDQDLSGKWSCQFEIGEPGEYPAVAEFEQRGNEITGTFLTETGDYRYLEGIVQGDEFQLSCFDGAHAFLFEGKIAGRDSIQGVFRSGKHYQAYWQGIRNPDARLKDPFTLNEYEKGSAVVFSGIDLQGNRRTTTDAPYLGKPKVIILMGTWCPNCRDANNYLKEYLASNAGLLDSVSFHAISFEAYKDTTRSLAAIRKYAEKMAVPYPVWLGGYKDKNEATIAVGVLDEVSSYPTLIFLDREDRIQHVHTGFSGPATSEYSRFDKQFRQVIEEIKR